MKKALVIVVVPSLLAGCNMVVSEKPWFAADSQRAVPQLKPGLWASLDDETCALDIAAPVENWPECAGAFVVQGGQFRAIPKEAAEVTNSTERDSIEPLIVAGDPLIVQIKWSHSQEPESPLNKGRKKDRPFFIYMGARVKSAVVTGSATELVAWSVVCGPIDEVEVGSDLAISPLTSRPFPGLRMVKNSNSCTARSQSALRAAAASSEAVSAKNGHTIVSWRWIRDDQGIGQVKE